MRDLRDFIRRVEDAGDLVRVERLVSPVFEIAAGVRWSANRRGPALLFENVDGSDWPVLGGLWSARRRAYLGLGVEPHEYMAWFANGIRHQIPPRLVANGPCKEVILLGDDADLNLLPACVHTRHDAGPFITMGITIARHPTYGNNVSISRMQVYDAKTAGLLSLPPQHLGIYFAEQEARGEPLPVAITIGNDPWVTLCSGVRGPIELDEYAVAGGWANEPIDLVKCETSDVLVPATSEIVLEGELVPGERRPEGPFGEVGGYYTPAAGAPIFRLHAITHRRDPIYVTALAGRPATDNHVIRDLTWEPMVYDQLGVNYRTIRDVYAIEGSSGKHVAISVKPSFPFQARDIMVAALTTGRVRPKLVIVVDEDVDVRDPVQLHWALANCVQPDRDVLIIPEMVGQTLDPSTRRPGVGSVMAIDATRRTWEGNWELAEEVGVEDFEALDG